jgi:hypothetical protein
MLRDTPNFTHHYPRKKWCDRPKLFNFETGHGQHIGQLLGAQRWIAKFAQPRLGELHCGRSRSKLLELA